MRKKSSIGVLIIPILEAIRQMRKDVGKKNVVYVHLTLVPMIKSAINLANNPVAYKPTN